MMSRAERQRRSLEGTRRYRENLTPELREQSRQKYMATRRANAEHREQLRAEQAAEEAKKEARREARKAKAAAKPKVRKERRQRQPKSVPDPRWLQIPGADRPLAFTPISPSYVEKRGQRFWAYVDQSGGPEACWPWHGARGQMEGEVTDYGYVSWLGKGTGAHRAAWMLHNGLELPPEAVVDHMCEIKWCVNAVSHLQAVTRSENNRRRHHREPEIARTATSFKPPWDDRWYPFGRRIYDEFGQLKPEYDRQERSWGGHS